MLELEHISKIYHMGDNVLYALNNVCVRVEPGDFVAIMGPSGSGKSTLMNILGLLDNPSSGLYRIDGQDVSKLNENYLAILRRNKLGFIFQQFNLLPRLTALENVALPHFYSAQGEDSSIGRNLLARVGLANRMDHKPNELSGGQQQRVAIARALINAPSVIFADEPTGNLDSKSAAEIMALLEDLNNQGITIVMVTHEESIGARAKRRIRMRDGKVVADDRLKPLNSGVGIPPRESLSSRGIFAMLFGFLKQAVLTLSSNRIRTGLSTLGILIGVAAVIVMMAIGSGARRQIQEQLASMGSNLLILRPGATRLAGVVQESSATRLTLDDASSLQEKISSIYAVSPTVSGRAQITFGNKNWNTQITGTTPTYTSMRAAKPARGRFFSQTENQSRAMLAVIGLTVARELFGEANPLGENIKINKLNFQVIGVLPEKGAQGPRDQDDIIIVPVQTAMRRLFGKDYVDSIEIQIRSGADLNQASDEILQYMSGRRRIPLAQAQEPFRIFNMAELQSAISSTSQTMSTLLAGIAAISLLVGGIGIMNIMLVSVTERTREIGLRKAVGARPFDILVQFIIESIVLTLVGGLMGILVGWLLTLLVARTAGWTTVIDPLAIAMAFFFSVSIGMIFGIYPARRASRLNPIEALRHE